MNFILSAIVCVKTQEEFLTRFAYWEALGSCKLEVIIVTGFPTKNLIKKSQNKITVIEQSGSGLYNAMNSGLEISSAEHVFFCGYTDSLVNIASVLETLIRSENQVNLYMVKMLNVGKAPKLIKVPNNPIYTHHQSIIINKNFLIKNQLKFSEYYRLHSDFDLSLQVFALRPKVARHDFIVCNFETDGMSNSGKYAFRSAQEFYKITKSRRLRLSWYLVMIFVRLFYYFTKYQFKTRTNFFVK